MSDALYDQFVERYFAAGDAAVPDAWPPSVQRRCRLFLALLESGESAEDAVTRSRGTADDPGDPDRSHRSTPLAADELPDLGDRYVVESEIARGGMGRVLLAHDRELRRSVAVKVLRTKSATRARRFIEEAQATAQLEHPNIAPVYDVGHDRDGSPFFAMKWIRGRDLESVLRSGEFSLLRLVQILQQVALAIEFAHSRGVVHRDLKPQNVMLGDYGEVLVVDWGLAKIRGLNLGGDASLDTDGEDRERDERVRTDRSDGLEHTFEGSVQGSLAYMPPEQARGRLEAIDARSDVFGLGAILYSILTGTPPHAGETSGEILGRAREGVIEPPGARAPKRVIPIELETICLRALSRDPAERHATAAEFHEALQAHVEDRHDAERRERESRRLMKAADRARDELHRAEQDESDASSALMECERRFSDHDSAEAKRPLLEALERREACREATERCFGLATGAYQAVLSVEPRHREARAALATLHLSRLELAQARGDRVEARLFESLVEHFDDGQHARFLRGDGELELTSEPSGAMVEIFRYEERGWFLRPSPAPGNWSTPCVCRLPRGSYLAVLRAPGHVETRYPVLVDPRAPHRAQLRLWRDEEVPSGFVPVTGGPTIVGALESGFDTLPRGIVQVDDFLLGRFPVTLGEYCRFLDALATHGTPVSEIESLRPRFGRDFYVERDATGRFLPTEKVEALTPALALPVTSMERYAGWLGETLDRRVRLPTEYEWERAARGADGRQYPWGNGFDHALAKTARSRRDRPRPEPVGAFPSDESPFGVRDLGGTIRELCQGETLPGYRPCRGGSWYNAYSLLCRSYVRTLIADGFQATDIGFRLAMDREP